MLFEPGNHNFPRPEIFPRFFAKWNATEGAVSAIHCNLTQNKLIELPEDINLLQTSSSVSS